jgi:hypothetical protein
LSKEQKVIDIISAATPTLIGLFAFFLYGIIICSNTLLSVFFVNAFYLNTDKYGPTMFIFTTVLMVGQITFIYLAWKNQLYKSSFSKILPMSLPVAFLLLGAILLVATKNSISLSEQAYSIGIAISRWIIYSNIVLLTLNYHFFHTIIKRIDNK